MCGLVGIASNRPQSYRAWLLAARETMAHRGPDDSGEWWSEDGRVGLAHRRLSIQDLSTAGHQPMHFAARALSIVFNGEIYNFPELRGELMKRGYAFRSNSDTEVLLAAYDAWGTDCLSRLNGMFAFALYDSPRRQLFLARDRAGEKPLFYRQDDGTLYFASELKALMAHPALPKRIDPVGLDCYLSMGFVPGDRCILHGYHKLPAAHAMTFDLNQGTARVWRYWQLPELEPEATAGAVDETALLNELEALLEDAVGRQLLADVPVGVLLSGGVDSSLVTAMAVRRSSHVRTFTIGFPGHGKLDETPHARLIARHFGTEHTELAADPTTADLIPILASQFDEPMVDSSMIPTWLVSHLVRQHCTVALGGDGGDELFGGYGHYTRLLWLQSKVRYLPRLIKTCAASLADHLLPAGFRGRTSLLALPELTHGLPSLATLFDPSMRRRLLSRQTGYGLMAEEIRRERSPGHQDLLQSATRLDFSDYLAEDILVKVDRASMLNSLEVRSPLLDHRVIEFAFGRVPATLKATGTGGKKILLKRLAARLLPPEFDLQRKQGFSIPLSQWLTEKGPFRELFWDVLARPDCLFDQRVVQNLLREQDRGFNHGERLFGLVLFELWRRHYGAEL